MFHANIERMLASRERVEVQRCKVTMRAPRRTNTRNAVWKYKFIVNSPVFNHEIKDKCDILVHEVGKATPHVLKLARECGIETWDARFFRIEEIERIAHPHTWLCCAMDATAYLKTHYPTLTKDTLPKVYNKDAMLRWHGGECEIGELWHIDGDKKIFPPRIVVEAPKC